MIVDTMDNAARYETLNSGFKAAFDFLRRSDLFQLEPGKYEIEGQKVFASVVKVQGRSADEAKIETHRKYIDIQMVLGGTDTMGWLPAAKCDTADTAYDPQKDLQFFKDKPESWVAVNAGAFAVFFPEDAHMPLISDGMVYKVIVKVAVDAV